MLEMLHSLIDMAHLHCNQRNDTFDASFLSLIDWRMIYNFFGQVSLVSCLIENGH